MTFLLHGVLGALPVWLVWRRAAWWMLLAVWVLGALPDIVHTLDWFGVPLPATLQAGEVWDWHRWSHQFHWWYCFMLWLPSLHVWVDTWWHDTITGEWLWWGVPVEIVMWIALAVLVVKVKEEV